MSSALFSVSGSAWGRRLAGALLACALTAPVVVHAQAAKPAATKSASADEESVRKLFGERFDGAEIDEVRRTPFGMYELRLGSQLIYTDRDVSYVMQGNLIDAKNRRNLTRERMEELMAVRFDELPLDLAIKQVRGSGARKVAIFEDPNCGYCKQLRKSMEGVENVTIYTFVYPILGDDSVIKSKNVICASDQGKVWDDWMLRNKSPARTAGCDTGVIDRTVELGQRLQVTGTPTIIFSDNTRISGAMPPAQFKAKLDSLGKS